MNKPKIRFIINFIYFATIIVLVVLILKFALPYFAPFILAYAIAASVQPFSRWITAKYKIKRKITGIISVIFCWVLLAMSIGIILYIVSRQAVGLLNNISSITVMINTVVELLTNWVNNIYDIFTSIPNEMLSTAISSISESIISFASSFATAIINFITNIFKATPTVLIFILVSILASIFISGDYDKIQEFITLQLSPKYKSRFVFVKQFFIGTAVKLLKSYLIIMLFTCIELALGLTIIGINYAVILAILISIFDILPYVGSGTILVPWGAVEIILGNYGKGIGIILIAIAITVIRNFLEPRIIGKETGTHPLLVLVAVYIGGKLLGFAGILLCPITVMFLLKLHKDGYYKLWKEKKETAQS